MKMEIKVDKNSAMAQLGRSLVAERLAGRRAFGFAVSGDGVDADVGLVIRNKQMKICGHDPRTFYRGTLARHKAK